MLLVQLKIVKQNCVLKTELTISWAIAASFLLLISLNLYHQNQGPQTDEIQEARMAYLQFKDGMDLVSKNLNKGTSKIVYVDYFEVTTNKIFK